MPLGLEQRPGHVDAVLEGAADGVVDRHVRLVQQRQEAARRLLHGRSPGEVPGGAAVPGRAEHVDAAREVGAGGRPWATIEHLTVVVGVPLRVPCDRGIAARLEVLAGRPERATVDETVRQRRVRPGLAAVTAVGDAAGAIAATVVVVAGDEVVRTARLLRDRGLVLGLAAALQVGDR